MHRSSNSRVIFSTQLLIREKRWPRGAVRTIDGAKNIDVTKEAGGILPWNVHSNIWQNPEVWNKVIENLK